MAVSKLRNLRVDGELWHLAKLVSDRRRLPMSQVMKTALMAFTDEWATEEERAEAVLLARAEAEADAQKAAAKS